MKKTISGIALLFTLVAAASIGCSVQTGTEPDVEASHDALRINPDVPDDTLPTSDTTPRPGKVTIPSNCTPTGGHDPYSGEPSYHCKQADGTFRLCGESDIRDKRPGCTAVIYSTPPGDGVGQQGAL